MADKQATFDPQAARAAGASDDYILQYLASRNPDFDIQSALQKAPPTQIIDFLAERTSPMGSTGSASGADTGPNAGLAPPAGAPPKELTPSYTGQALNPEKYREPAAPSSTPAGGYLSSQFADPAMRSTSGKMAVGALLGAAIPYAGVGAASLAGGGGTGLLANMATQGALSGGLTYGLGGGKRATGWATGLGAAGPLVDWGLSALTAAPSKLSAPLAETVSVPRGASIPESATPLQLQQYADENGIPVNAAQLTEHNLPRNVMSAGERASVGGTGVRQMIERSKSALMTHVENFMARLSPLSSVTDQGTALQTSVESALDRERVVAGQNFAAVDQAVGDPRIDTTPIVHEAQAQLAKSAFVRKEVPSLSPKVTGVLEDLADLQKPPTPPQAQAGFVPGAAPAATAPKTTATFSELQSLRSRISALTRDPAVAISKDEIGWLKSVNKVIDSQMANAATASNPQGEALFRTANAHWKQIEQDFNTPGEPLYQVLMQTNPDKVPELFTGKGQIGGSPFKISLLDKYGIDKGIVKRAILQDIYNHNFGTFQGGKTLAGYNDKFLNSVFTRDELSGIYKTGALARSVGLNVNPSGTAATTSAIEESPLGKDFWFKGAKAKATKSEWFNQWMMTPAPSRLSQAPQALNPFLPGARSAAQQSLFTPSGLQERALQQKLKELGITPPAQSIDYSQYPLHP
jgi:hypothetical protein